MCIQFFKYLEIVHIVVYLNYVLMKVTYGLAFLKPKISSDYIYSKTNRIMLIRPHFQLENLS